MPVIVFIFKTESNPKGFSMLKKPDFILQKIKSIL